MQLDAHPLSAVLARQQFDPVVVNLMIRARAAMAEGGPLALKSALEIDATGDGVEITRRPKAFDQVVSVIMLTGVNDDRLLLATIEAGCAGFLTKERAAALVANAVRTGADGEAQISPEMLARLLPSSGAAPRRRVRVCRSGKRDPLAQVAQGLPDRAIAEVVHLSVNTVRNDMQSILSKLGAHSKLEAVSLAVKTGIIDYLRQ